MNCKNGGTLYMIKRFISGLIATAILFGVYFLKNDVVFNIAVTIIALIGIGEFYHAVRQKNIRPLETLRLYLLFVTFLCWFC